MKLKPPTTFKQQLELLKSRGIIIGDEMLAEEFLNRVNYYRFTSYLLPFRNPDGTYKENVTFNKISRIYEFDRKLRALLFSVVEEIEIMLRTQLSNYHALKYGSLGYLEKFNFSDGHKHWKFLKQIYSAIEKNEKQVFVKHHINNYNSKFPIWVIIELFTMGELSHFFGDMITTDKKTIAKKLFFTNNINAENWLICLTHLRNCCAHYQRLYNSVFPPTPITPKGLGYTLKKKIFDYILVVKLLYFNPIKWENEFMVGLNALLYEYEDCISLHCMGFPSNWEDLLSKQNPKIAQ